MLIGLTGFAGSGKSEVAALLMAEFGARRVKFADGLKSMTRTLLRDMGFCAADVERMVEGDLKESEIPELGVTPRHLMVTLGTEWGRVAVRQDLWIRLWGARVDTMLSAGGRVVADDVRFPNEVEEIRSRGGEIWRIERPGLAAGNHVSERLEVVPDRVILNDGTLAALRCRAARAARASGPIAHHPLCSIHTGVQGQRCDYDCARDFVQAPPCA